MTKVRETVSLHPKTVSEHPKHTVKKHQKTARQIVSSTKVDLRVWRTALKLAKGDATRIKVKSSTEVIVLNQSKKKW